MRKRVIEIGVFQLLATILGVVLLAIVLAPTPALSSAGQNVNLSDKSKTTTLGEARISNNKLGVGVCDLGSVGVGVGNCAGVANGSLNVEARDRAPATPYVARCDAGSTGDFATCAITVPNGARPVVIESVSIDAFVPTGQSLFICTLTFVTGGVTSFPRWFLQQQGTDSFGGVYYANPSSVTRYYVDPGSNISVSCLKNSATGNIGAELSISGYR
jgi:hypothetical protein